MTDPLPISAARWAELAWLREIPDVDREHWRLSPPDMSYAAASRWARDEVRASKVIRITSGETLVRLPDLKPVVKDRVPSHKARARA
jgi:hypothetical protein